MQKPTLEHPTRNSNNVRNNYTSQHVIPQISYAGMARERVHNQEPQQQQINNDQQVNTESNMSTDDILNNTPNIINKENSQAPKSLSGYDIAKFTAYVTRDIIKTLISKIIPETLTMLLQVVQMNTTPQQKTHLLKEATETIIENAFNTDSEEDPEDGEEPAAEADQEETQSTHTTSVGNHTGHTTSEKWHKKERKKKKKKLCP